MIAGRIPENDWPLFRGLINPQVYEQMSEETALLLGLTEEGKAIGALAVLFYEEGPEIASVYVDPEYREKGGGSILLSMAEGIADEAGTDLVAELSASDRDQAALRHMLKKRGYELLPQETSEYCFSIRDLPANSYGSKTGETKAFFLKELADIEKKHIGNYALSHGLFVPKGGLLAKTLDQEVSAVIPGEKGEFAFALVEKEKEGLLSLSGLYNGTENPELMMKLLQKVLNKAVEIYPPNTKVVVVTVNETAEKLVKYFLPEAVSDLFVYQYLGKRGKRA